MDMNLLYAILIALVPVVITIIVSRLYNIVHGLITFIVTGFLLMFCLEAFGGNLPAEIMGYIPTTCSLYTVICDLIADLLDKVGLASLLAQDYGKYILLAIYLVVFIISQIIASAIRKSRVEKINSLKRQLKRY